MENIKPKLLKLDIQFFAGGVEELNLEQALTGRELLTYSRNLATPQNYLADLFFPARETSELTVDVVTASSRLPVMAQIGELGTQVEYGSREGMTGSRIQIPKIQRGRAMDEKLVRLLLQDGLRSNELSEIRRTQLDDASYAVDAIKARKEWIGMQAISTGKVTYAEGGVQFTADFGYTDDQKPVLSGTDKWSDIANSTPLVEIQGWVNEAADRGVLLKRAMTSRHIVSLLLQNKSLRIAYHGDPSGTANPPQLNKAQLDTLMETHGLPTIVAYDTVARVEKKALVNNRPSFNTVRMMPQDRFVLLPDGPLGDYLWAKTTEEMMNEIESVETDSNGIFVFRKINEHPIRIETIGVNLAFPSFGFNDSVVTATVI
ncbi:major capsid protein [Sporosarcina saromensis]|uniref:Major capsid protein n=1 Tax=Sporosarcina saromensis TaxID=359365 RepID=A0ABU4G9W3_9BACL|nr:major capsid protein [Sporosarcina saromensis]MDW0113769.1 major capsid protein [Sporosarcina saromensis]